MIFHLNRGQPRLHWGCRDVRSPWLLLVIKCVTTRVRYGKLQFSLSLCCCRYVWENIEVGYVQGMCDLAAPLLVIFDDGESFSVQFASVVVAASNCVIRLETRRHILILDTCMWCIVCCWALRIERLICDCARHCFSRSASIIYNDVSRILTLAH